MAHLPNDAIFEIMSFLADDKRIQVSRVCRDWYQITTQYTINIDYSARMTIDNYSNFLSCPFLSQVKTLNLSKNNLSEENIIALANCTRFTQLEELILQGNDFTMSCAEAFAKSSYIRQLKYIDFRDTNFSWDDTKVGQEFIDSQPEDMKNFWYLVLGNCGEVVVLSWLSLAGKGSSSLHVSTQLDLAKYLVGVNNLDLAVEWLEQAAKNENPEAMFKLGLIYQELDPTKYGTQIFQNLYKSANLGYASSFFLLADCYRNGSGVEANEKEALRWYFKAAEEDDADGLVSHEIGSLYFEGAIIEHDIPKALEWFSISLGKGCTLAKFAMGSLFIQGRVVQMDMKKGISLLEEAALEGSPEALNFLGTLYLEGEGVDIDPEKANSFFQSAAEADNPEAAFNLGTIAENEGRFEEAIKWYNKAHLLGNPNANLGLARLYQRGDGVPKDVVKAVEYIMEVAEDGDTDAQITLGDIYSDKTGTIFDIQKAIHWYSKAAESRDVEALFNLGYAYEGTNNTDMACYWYEKAAEEGKVVALNNIANIKYEEKNYEKALEYIQKAIEHDNAYALCTLAEWHLEGLCVEKSYEQAFELFTKSCGIENDKCATSHFELSKFYEEGLCCEKDSNKARELLVTAAGLGEERAFEKLESQSKKRRYSSDYNENNPKKKK